MSTPDIDIDPLSLSPLSLASIIAQCLVGPHQGRSISSFCEDRRLLEAVIVTHLSCRVQPGSGYFIVSQDHTATPTQTLSSLHSSITHSSSSRSVCVWLTLGTVLDAAAKTVLATKCPKPMRLLVTQTPRIVTPSTKLFLCYRQILITASLLGGFVQDKDEPQGRQTLSTVP